MKIIVRSMVALLLLLMASAVMAQEGVGKGDPVSPDESDDGGIAGYIEVVDADAETVNEILLQGTVRVEAQDLLRTEDFASDDAWELFEGNTGSLRLEGGRYILTQDQNWLWGQDEPRHTDVVIQVTAEQLSPDDNVGYGIMCRASDQNNGDGYHLWASGLGYAAILVIDGDRIDFIADWTRTDAVNQGQALNNLVAVCSGDYLALYVNGELVVEGQDDTFSEGLTGFSGSTFDEVPTVEVAFDDAHIWEASAADTSGMGSLFSENTEGDTEQDDDDDGGGLGGLLDDEGEEGDDGDGGGLGDVLGGGDEDDSDLRDLADDTDALRDEVQSVVAQGDPSLTVGELLLFETFDTQDAWELYEDADGSLTIEDDGYYLITNNYESGIILWGQNREVHTDVVMEVTMEQLTSEDDNAFGLMCRADPANTLDGYHFYISGDGFYAILVVEDEGETISALVDFTATDAINQGMTTNQMTVVCNGDTLALYVNGELLEEITDSTYSEGVAGMTAVDFVEGVTTEIRFDDLRIWEVAGQPVR